MPLGTSAQIGYAVETSAGTYETVDTFFEVVPPLQVGFQPTRVKPRGIRAGRQMPHAVVDGAHRYAFTATHELVAESTGLLLEACIDGAPTTTGASTPYQHVFEAGSALNSISSQIGLPSAAAVHPIQVFGMKATGWTLTNDPSGVFPLLTIDWAGEGIDYDGTPALASASYATFTRFTFAHAVFSVGGSEVCVDNYSLTGVTGYDAEDKICSTGSPKVTQLGPPTVTGSFVTDLASLTQFTRLHQNTQAAFDLTYTSGSSAIFKVAGNVYFTGDSPTIDSTGKVKETVNFEFLSGTSDAAALTMTLTNSDSAA